MGCHIGNLFCFTTTNPYIYIALRTVSGLFDCVICITQAYSFSLFFISSYVADISSIKNRAACFARLESVMNAGQCIGPLIAGIISNWSVRIAMYFLFFFFHIDISVLVVNWLVSFMPLCFYQNLSNRC